MENTQFDTEKYLLDLVEKHRFKMMQSLIVYYIFTFLMIFSLIGYFIFSILVEQITIKYITLISTIIFLIVGVFSFRRYNYNKLYYDLNNFILNMMK